MAIKTDIDIIYRYVGGAEDETEIPCPDLEDIL